MNNLTKFTLSSLLLAIGLILPLFFGQVEILGQTILVLHIPIYLCGLLCGANYGMVVGFILPILRSCLFSMPIFYPNAIAMAVELALYGFVSGYLWHKRKVCNIYLVLLISMIIGRLGWGIMEWLLLCLNHQSFTLNMFITLGFVQGIVGIIIQFLIIPPLYKVMKGLIYVNS